MNNIFVNWTTALRSGTYTQGKNYLRKTDGSFCVLGVLCDTVDPTGWEDVQSDPDRSKDSSVPYLGANKSGTTCGYETFPPGTFIRMLDLPLHMNGGMDIHIPTSLLNNSQRQKVVDFMAPSGHTYLSSDYCISTLNDAGISFEELADLIEGTFEYYSEQ
jgi:hypothetical protein